jgi:hypothetical protein
VRTAARAFTAWDEGGGVMDEVVRGAGDVNLTRSGDGFDMSRGAADSERDAERSVGVSGRATSVDGMKGSCDGWYSGAWLSMLRAQTVSPSDARHVRFAGCSRCDCSAPCPVYR